MKRLQKKLDVSLLYKQFRSAAGGSICSSCEAFVHTQTSSSLDLLLDIAWLLKNPASENFERVVSTSHIQRCCYLLDFLVCNDSTIMLGKILPNLIILTEIVKSNLSDVDTAQLLKCMGNARDAIYQKHHKGGGIVFHSKMEDCQSCSQDDMLSVVEVNSQVRVINFLHFIPIIIVILQVTWIVVYCFSTSLGN